MSDVFIYCRTGDIIEAQAFGRSMIVITCGQVRIYLPGMPGMNEVAAASARALGRQLQIAAEQIAPTVVQP